MTLNSNGVLLNGSSPRQGTSSKIDSTAHESGQATPSLLSQFLKSQQELESYRYELTSSPSALKMKKSQISDAGLQYALTVRPSAWQA